ncbi:hypothetical protein COLO4_21437 [Corchorus olitorius]|uniref:Uncharacterized protein n=1 Tax=Corchorus olitorius TaxID=93759 RepID=A0A1R3IT76_9ROSI|nr:hypothetical protein COLO4_21437 [Corchorus olitorius]
MDYKVGKEDIVDVFGLPNSGEFIVESRNAIDREKLHELYNIDSSKKIYLQDLVIDLDKIDGYVCGYSIRKSGKAKRVSAIEILASSWGVQEMNTLLSGIDDYEIEKKGSGDEPKLSDHDVQTDDCNKEKHGLEEDTIMSWSDDCEDVKGPSVNGDGHEQCPMDEADVPTSPKKKGDDGDELQWLKMEFAKTNAKVESCMSLLNVVMEDVKFIKSQLLDGSKSYFAKQNEGIPCRDGDGGERHNAFAGFEKSPDLKESRDGAERHNAFGSFEKNPDFKESMDGGERHNAFGGFEKTPDFKESMDGGERHNAFGGFEKTPYFKESRDPGER